MKKTLLLKLLATQKLKLQEGLIELDDTQFNLLPALFVSSLLEHFLRRDEPHKLYIISWFWGFDLVQAVKHDLNLDSADEVYKVGMDLAESMGLGVYHSHDYHPGQYTKFRIETNPYLRHLNIDRFDGPVDYVVAGAMAGGGCHVHSAICQTVEVQCKAQKNEACEFITGTHDDLTERTLWKTVEERYHIGDIHPFQRDVFQNYDRAQSQDFVEKLHTLLEQI